MILLYGMAYSWINPRGGFGTVTVPKLSYQLPFQIFDLVKSITITVPNFRYTEVWYYQKFGWHGMAMVIAILFWDKIYFCFFFYPIQGQNFFFVPLSHIL